MVIQKKRYVLFVDEEQVRSMIDAVNDVLSKAIDANDRVKVVLYAGTLSQLHNPKEILPKNRGWFTLVKEQVLGGK